MPEIQKIAQDYLYNHIPITRHLQVHVDSYDGHSIRLSAPLAANINHRDTVFGGSLATVAILTGWTIIHLALLEEKIESRLVIQKSEMEFLEPALTDFYAECTLPTDGWLFFLKMLQQKGKARITLHTTLFSNSVLVGEHDGIYVAVRKNQS
jgi:thioesterase domain-containing protein